MRTLLFLSLCTTSLLASIPSNEEEGLSLRRIADFWQEGEYQLAKSQMEEFLTQFPESGYAETLQSALGDLYMREKNYQSALGAYTKVRSEENQNKIYLNRLQCFYHLQWYASLADECEMFLKEKTFSDEETKLKTTYLLAIALYQQCLNSLHEPENLKATASRAKPYFETLYASDLSEEVAQAFAHLCCILQDFEGASRIYLDLASKQSESEEFLFQAALFQAKYDKEKAIETFASIDKLHGTHAKEAAYNQLILSFELGKFAAITKKREESLSQVPAEKEALVHLILGKSFLAQNQHAEAGAEFQHFLDKADRSDLIRPALSHLLEAAYQANDLNLFDASVKKIEQINKTDPEMPRILFTRALLLKKRGAYPECLSQLEELLARFSEFQEREQASFELAHTAYAAPDWEKARIYAWKFITEFPSHELSSFVWRYFVSASSFIAAAEQLPSIEKKEQYVSDLKHLFERSDALPEAEISDWKFFCAKCLYEMQKFSEASLLLKSLISSSVQFEQRINAELLLALALRDGEQDEQAFSSMGEEALKKGQTLLSPGQLHLSLYNSYLNQADFDRAASHLRAAFESKIEIQLSNLAWLADYYYEQSKSDEAFAPSALEFISLFIERAKLSPENIKTDAYFLEGLFVKVAKLFQKTGQNSAAISLLERLLAQYASSPEHPWTAEAEVRLILGESYAQNGLLEKAEKEFDGLVALNPSMHNPLSASASLQGVRIKIKKLRSCEHPSQEEVSKVAAALKDLVVQKKLANEPTHLEAALDYVDLMTSLTPDGEKKSKRLSLLKRTKEEFEAQDNLLSKDYHASKDVLPDQYKIYLSYIQYIETEILITQASLSSDFEEQKQLQAKAKTLLLQIKGETIPRSLVDRVGSRLDTLEIAHESAT